MENKIYSWWLKKGNIIIQKNRDCVSLKLDYENEEYCLLNRTDTYEIIELLTNISRQIWEDPIYERKLYSNQLYQTNGNVYSWEIMNTQLLIKYNEIEGALEIKSIGNNNMNLEINFVVEIIQVLEQLNK